MKKKMTAKEAIALGSVFWTDGSRVTQEQFDDLLKSTALAMALKKMTPLDLTIGFETYLIRTGQRKQGDPEIDAWFEDCYASALELERQGRVVSREIDA